VVFVWLLNVLPPTTVSPIAHEPEVVPQRLTAQETDPFKGRRDAPVTVIMVGSYTCPACAESAVVLDQLLALYPESVKIVWKDTPESVGDSYRAALAARCAQQQGRFWEYHDVLYANREQLATRAFYALWAKALGLREDIFTACLDGAETKALVDRNIGEVLQAGVSEVPYFQINNEQGVSGSQSLGYFRTAVETALETVPQL
ncbi:MAG: thioredoxin domain-containing protein, partial [Rectinemataceae bacterium]|nr:thioredoxin domain-containing protein [Rectinemataceae bacterium]